MSEVKWIKISTNVFDNRKIRMIEKMPEGDAIIIIWFKVLCLAGTVNDNGMIMFTNEIPYTEEMIASQFDRPISVIRLAFQTFIKFGMLEVVDNILKVSNWEKYQNTEGMEKIREQNRLRKRKERERKLLTSGDSSNSHVKSRDSHATDIDIDKEKSIYSQQVADKWNEIVKSLPKVIKVTETRRKAIKSRSDSLDEFEQVFRKVQSSDFLSGRDGNWNGCGFDWVLKQSNWMKILEGNYDNKKTKSNYDHIPTL